MCRICSKVLMLLIHPSPLSNITSLDYFQHKIGVEDLIPLVSDILHSFIHLFRASILVDSRIKIHHKDFYISKVNSSIYFFYTSCNFNYISRLIPNWGMTNENPPSNKKNHFFLQVQVWNRKLKYKFGYPFHQTCKIYEQKFHLSSAGQGQI